MRKGKNGRGSSNPQQLSLPFKFGRRQPSPSRLGPRVRIALVQESDPPDAVVLRGSADIYALFRDEAASWDREQFLTVILDNKHKVLAVDQVSVGSLTASIVHPREVFKAILLANAAAFICVHNHPSGDPTPSKEDLEITRRLKEGAELLGIRLLDHIIIGKGRFVSFVDDGYW
jgi:DNA repair protein RadC